MLLLLMTISIEKKSKLGRFVKLAGKDNHLHIFMQELPTVLFKDSDELVVIPNGDESSNFVTDNGGIVVAGAGEFEKNGVFVLTMKNRNSDKEFLNVVEVELDGVRVLYYSATSEVNKDSLGEIGLVDVLLIKVNKDFNNQLKAVSVIDPQVVIPIFDPSSEEIREKFKSDLGVQFDQEKKFKCRAIDFSNDEYALQGVEIEG